MVAVRAALLTADERGRVSHIPFEAFIWVSVVTHLMLSLLTNTFATSIMALQAWCVRIDCSKDVLLIVPSLPTARTCMKEILQVSEEKWDRCPNPYTGGQDIGSRGRIGRALYIDRCKFCLCNTSTSSHEFFGFFSPQVMTLVSPFISGRLPSGALGDIFMPVAVQLAVRNRFQGITSSCIDSVI